MTMMIYENLDNYVPKILLADDSQDNLYTMSLLLKKMNLKIITAINGLDAVDKTQEEMPDMIILDIQMPIMNGFEACEKIKTNERTKHIPIMFATSKYLDVQDKVRGLTYGADDYLTKPYDPSEFQARVKVMLRLREAQMRLEQKNRHYMEMLSFISHELKNPLTSILGAAETLKNGLLGDITPPQQQFLEIMDRNAGYIQSMLERYLNLSKLEKGEIVPDVKTIDLIADALEPVLTNIQLLIKMNKRSLEIDEKSLKEGALIISDPELLKVVLNNLFSNAIKYSDSRGEIKYFFYRKNESIIFEIQNSSEGLDEKELSMLFHKFSRLRNAITKRDKGTGLGLYNSKEILKLLNCDIKCESKIGEYVKFIVTFNNFISQSAPIL